MENLQRKRAVREANVPRSRTLGTKARAVYVSEVFLDDMIIIPFFSKEGQLINAVGCVFPLALK